MIILITGATHTGKTALAQKLLEKYGIPFLSMDHLKMGLIRSGLTSLSPEDDEKLTAYLWPVVREIIKTAIENRQNLTVEGAYVPKNWRNGFNEEYSREIRAYCLIMTEYYIETYFDDIKRFANAAELRRNDSHCTKELLLKENARYMRLCRTSDCVPVLIEDEYAPEAAF